MPFFGNLSTAEWLIIGVVVVVLFGNKKLTELGRGLGESGRELKRVKSEFDSALSESQMDLKETTEKPKKSKKK